MQGELPIGMAPHMLTYRFFAKAYGWTPEQVNSLTEEEYEWLLKIEEGHVRALELKQRREAASRRAGRHER
jgi:hypothetical protein